MYPLVPVSFFANSKRPSAEPEQAVPATPVEMALDTLSSVLRILGEYALDTEQQEAAVFTRMSEQWAQHVAVASPVPGPEGAAGKTGEQGRRDWTGVREFVREYCKASAQHTHTVMGDLRQVIWVFIQNLNHSFAQDHESDTRIVEQLGKLESLAAQGNSTAELKREVMATVVALAHIVDQRKQQQRERVENLGAQVATLGSELDSARKDSEVDPLTGLFNRRAFDGYLARSVELSRAFGQPVSLLLVDMDGFKLINDTFGHPEGDAALRRLSDALTRTFPRKSDFVARFGGDEFAAVLRETPLKDGAALGDRLLKAARATEIDREGIRIKLAVSIGIAALMPGEDLQGWLMRADQALYEAKRQGRNRLVVASDTQMALVPPGELR